MAPDQGTGINRSVVQAIIADGNPPDVLELTDEKRPMERVFG
jgi:hypothetical protein